jgi:hypothetical protein
VTCASADESRKTPKVSASTTIMFSRYFIFFLFYNL